LASTSDIAKRYFAALAAHDLEHGGARRVVLDHADPVTGDVRRQLEQAAEAP
jgi:hypothetical protein